MKEIGSYEAKTKLAELLKKVAKGQEFVITIHGQQMAKLGPVFPARKTSPAQVVEEILSFHTKEDCSKLSTRELMQEGRR